MRYNSNMKENLSAEAILRKFCPELAERMDYLKRIREHWQEIVGSMALAKYSSAYDLKNNKLYIYAKNPQVGQKLNVMKGNIIGKVKGIDGVVITLWIPKAKYTPSKPRANVRRKIIEVSDDEANEIRKKYSESYAKLEETNPEAAHAIARLQVLIAKKFPEQDI